MKGGASPNPSAERRVLDEFGFGLGVVHREPRSPLVYGGHADAALPSDLPAGAAATASDTLSGAVEVADRLPQARAGGVLELAREAFTQALEVAATLSGALLVTAALLVARLLGRRGATAPATLTLAPQQSGA